MSQIFSRIYSYNTDCNFNPAVALELGEKGSLYFSNIATLLVIYQIAFKLLPYGALSAGVSVTAVISLAFQLTDCLKDLYNFRSLIREAPESSI